MRRNMMETLSATHAIDTSDRTINLALNAITATIHIVDDRA
jgi:hypothetical protein